MADRSQDTGSTDTGRVGGPRKGVTPPKGRPTRARHDVGGERRAFGPIAQWITVALLVVLVIVALMLVTDGGDFNPFNDDGAAPAAVLPPAEPG